MYLPFYTVESPLRHFLKPVEVNCRLRILIEVLGVGEACWTGSHDGYYEIASPIHREACRPINDVCWVFRCSPHSTVVSFRDPFQDFRLSSTVPAGTIHLGVFGWISGGHFCCPNRSPPFAALILC